MSFDDLARRMKERHADEGFEVQPAAGADDPFLRRQQRSRAMGRLVGGACLAGVGILITVLTYDSASSGGGTYIVAYGPIVAGVIMMFRGLAALGS